jgi:hypothetical protein
MEQKEHLVELEAFFKSKYKKEKQQERLKKKNKPYHKLTFVSKSDEFALVDKNDVSISRVSRVPKKDLNATLDKAVHQKDKSNSKLLSIKYDILFDFYKNINNEREYETILERIDPLEKNIKDSVSKIERLDKMKKDKNTKVSNEIEKFSLERELLLEQLKQEADPEILEDYVKVSKDLFEANKLKRKLETTILEID